MSTSKRNDSAKERFWRRELRQWRQSGLSVRAYCEQHGLAEPSFYAWRRTLAEREAVSFVPVRVVPPDDEAVAAGPATAGGLELVLTGGRTLRIGLNFDAATLQRLLALLEEGQAC